MGACVTTYGRESRCIFDGILFSHHHRVNKGRRRLVRGCNTKFVLGPLFREARGRIKG